MILSGMRAGEMFSLDELQEVQIGRSRTCDLVLDEPGVSRVHCRITRRRGRLVVEDMGSTNGVIINGIRTNRANLSEGDRLQIGSAAVLQLRFADAVEDTLARRLLDASTKDPLTGLFNRRYFESRLDAEISYALRHNRHLACIIVDVDLFKAVNDKYGHATGDVVLRSVAAAINDSVRTEDLVCRIGGEEFALLVRVNDIREAELLAERVRQCVKALKIRTEKGTLHVTVSAGVAELTECGSPAVSDDLVATADGRLYQAKALGRDRVCGSA
jgi:diguanylate cyclase (GGDEF)-like protein